MCPLFFLGDRASDLHESEQRSNKTLVWFGFFSYCPLSVQWVDDAVRGVRDLSKVGFSKPTEKKAPTH